MAFSLLARNLRFIRIGYCVLFLSPSIEAAVAGRDRLKHHLVWGQTVPIEIGVRAQSEGHQDVVVNKGTVNFMREQINVAV